MDTFSKYSTLPWNLRNHALSFASLNSLRQYSGCSKQCNDEFGKQHIAKRACLHLKESENEVELKYGQYPAFRYCLKFVKANEDSYLLKLNDAVDETVCKGDYKQAAVGYVKHRLKYNWNGSIYCPNISMNFWPFDAQDMKRIGKYEYWNIHFNRQMFQQFYDLIKDEKFESFRLHLMNSMDLELNIPAAFFKTAFFQNLAAFSCDELLPEFDAQDFLTMKASKIWLCCSSFTDEVINQKLCQYFNNPSADRETSYTFFKNVAFDREEVFENIPFISTNIEGGVENVVVKHASGVEKKMRLVNDNLYHHYQIDFY